MDPKEDELTEKEAAQGGKDSETKYAVPDPPVVTEMANNGAPHPTNAAQDSSLLNFPAVDVSDDPAAPHGAGGGSQSTISLKPPLPLKPTPGKPPKLSTISDYGVPPSLSSTLSPPHTQGARAHRAAATVDASSVDLGAVIATLNDSMTAMLSQSLTHMTSKMDDNNARMEERFQSQLQDLERRQRHIFDAPMSNYHVDKEQNVGAYRQNFTRHTNDSSAHARQYPQPPLHGTPPPVEPRSRHPNDLRNEIADLQHHMHNLNHRPPVPQRPFDQRSPFESFTDRRHQRPPFETSSDQRFQSFTSSYPSAADTTSANRQILNSSRYPTQRPEFSARQSAGQSFRLDGRAADGRQNFHQRSNDRLRERSVFMNGIDLSNADLQDSGDLQGTVPQYGMSRMVEHAIRSLDPSSNLQFSLKKLVTLSKVATTYRPWCNYWKGAFNTCYLNCLVYIDPRHTPGTRADWEAMDNDRETAEARRTTVQLLQGGATPNPTRDDSVLQLNGIFLGVIDVFPKISPLLVNGMRDSLEEGSLVHIRDEDQNDTISLRTMYFGAHMQFLSPLNDARESALMDLISNTKYKLNMSPLEFLDKTLIRAKKVDTLFQSRQVTDSQLWTIVFRALKETAGSLYDGCIDRFRTDPGYSENSPETLREIFQVMDTKYKEAKRSADEPYAMIAHDGGTSFDDETLSYQSFVYKSMEAANFAGGGQNGAKNAVQRRSKTSQNTGEKKDMPCYAFQRNGKCDYPNCKYSHDPRVIANAPPPPEKGTFIAMLLDDAAEKSVAYTELAAALIKAKRDVKKLSRFKKKVMKSKSEGTGSTYQSVVKGDAKAHALVPYVPDGSSSSTTIQQIVTDDDESDNDDHCDTADESITDDSQE